MTGAARVAAVRSSTRETLIGDTHMKRGLAVRPRSRMLVTLLSHFDGSSVLTARMIASRADAFSP